jgi:hypothetical protein
MFLMVTKNFVISALSFKGIMDFIISTFGLSLSFNNIFIPKFIIVKEVTFRSCEIILHYLLYCSPDPTTNSETTKSEFLRIFKLCITYSKCCKFCYFSLLSFLSNKNNMTGEKNCENSEFVCSFEIGCWIW